MKNSTHSAKVILMMFALIFAFWFSAKSQVTNVNTSTSYSTIQAAIDDASNGHTIEVAPGTYSEAVVLNKSITLRGQTGMMATTIIKAPASLPLPATQNSNIVTVTGATVSAEIFGLTISGPGPINCDGISFGIFVRDGANANIHDNQIIDVRDQPFGGCQNGVAIQVGRNFWSTTGTATIKDNIIKDYQKNGITVDNTGSSATITGNTITGIGTTNIIAQNGIQISRGATATLSDNIVSGNSFHLALNPFDWSSTGILLFESGAVTMSGDNNLSGNDQNLYVYNPTGAVTLGAEVFGTSSAPLGFGNQITNFSSLSIDARSCTFGGVAPAAMTMTQLFTLEDYVFHSIDNPTLGFVYVKTNNTYVTTRSYDTDGGYPDAQIQRGIDAASNGFTVNVQSGNYAKQIAVNRSVFGTNGPHQFGLFVDKDNLTIKGYKAADAAVTNASEAAVVFTTGATNNFGSSGIFVQANGVTLEGLKVGNNLNSSNANDNNKTIEIIGDAFSMTKCWINPSADEGAVYMGRWDALHPISSYTITGNKFENTLVSINNGVGLSGPRTGRLITNNEFIGVATPYLIGFRGWNGPGPVQGWIVDPVGGAVVTGNIFNTTGVDKYVVARGNAGGYINSELFWADIWNLNTYGNHVVTLVSYPTFDVRSYADATGYTETRSISPLIQENIGIAQTGDVVLVSAGPFNESLNINKSVTLKGAQADICAATRSGDESIINCVNGIGVNASNVTINGFTIQGQTSANSAPGFGYAVYMAPPNTGTQLINNIIRNNVVGSSVSNAGASPSQVLISCNWFDVNNNPGPASGSGIYTDEYVAGGAISNVLIDNNKFTGHIDDGGIDFSVTQPAVAASGITISNNDFDGNRRAAFLFNLVSSSFVNNVIHNSTGVGTGEVRIYGGVDNLQIKNNSFAAAAPYGIRITDDGGISSNITVFENSFTGYSNTNTAIEIVSGYTGTLPATCNWWNTTTPAAIAAQINGTTTYIPYLNSGTDNSPATGFQPLPNSCTGGIPKLTTSINGVIVNANNDGNNDAGSFSVCNTATNILFNSFTDQNGLSDPLLKVYQTYTASNVTVPFCNNCWASMAAFAGATGTAALVDPASPGTLTMTFRSWLDANNDGIVDPTEFASDLIVYTITVNPVPTLSFDITGSSVASLNNGVADPSESATVAVCNGGTYSVSNVVNSSSANRYSIVVTPSGGGLLFNGSPAGNADINAAQFSGVVGLYTITLSNPLVGGTLVQVITPYTDVNNNSNLDAGDCVGDPITITYIGYAIPNAIATPSSQEACSGAAIATIALTSDVSGTTFSWTRDNTAAVTGIAGSGSGDISGVLTNTTSSPVTVTFTITPQTANCIGTSISATVVVQGKITISAPTVTQPTCAVPGGKIVVNATAGGILEYSIDGGTNWYASNTFNGLPAGNYNIAVRLYSNPACAVVYGSNPVVLVPPTGCTNCVLTCPGNITVYNKKGYCGANVCYYVAKSGSCGTITYSKASNSFFNIGTTTVTVTSSTGKTCSFNVTVIDKQKPDIVCPADIVTTTTANACSKVVTFSVTAKDNCPGVTVTTVPASGSAFPVGVTKVTATATDASGNKSTSTFTVKVKDAQAPVINLAASPIKLTWPANGSYQTINVSQFVLSVSDNCGAIPVTNVKIMKVASDEAENAPGNEDGNTNKDIKITDNCKSVDLRRERKEGGNGRVYTIYLSVSDASGNSGAATFKVIATTTQTGTTAVDNGAAYFVYSNCDKYYYRPAEATTTEQLIVKAEVPEGFTLDQNFPNPFNGVTIIRYGIPIETKVNLGVYNQLGQRVAQLVEGRMSAGYHQERFDAGRLAAGIYLYRLQAVNAEGKQFVINKKMVVTK